MRSHPLNKLLLAACLLAGATLSASGQRPGGPPPGSPAGPPPGGPPIGGPSAGTHGPGGNAPGSGSGNSSSTRPAQQFGPVGRWWDDKAVVRTIGLSQDQQRKMDSIFNANKPAILATYKTFLSEKAKLDAMSKQANVDQTAMFAQIDAVSQARAALQKANTQMLLQIRQQMDQDQIAKLEKLQ